MTDWKTRTKLVHSGARRSQYGEMSEAIFLTQGFVYDSAEQAEARFIKAGEDEFIYARYGNPTVRMFEDRIADIEGCEDAFATASGMAAVNAALTSLLQAGDHVVAARALFGSCLYVLEILARFGVEVTLIDGTDLDQWRGAVRDDTKAVFLESVSNPTLEVIDIAGVSAIAHAKGALVIVDNVFATPTFSRAVEQGADVIVYSATKHIDGGGRCLGGVICGTRDYIRKVVEPYLKHTGGAMSPFNAWVMLKGLETLDLRVRAQADNALHVAQGAGRPCGVGPRDLSGACLAPPPRLGDGADGVGWDGGVAGTQGRAKGGICVPQRVGDHQDLQQPWGCEIHHHPSRHHHAPTPAR